VKWREWQRGQPKPYVEGHEPKDEYVVDENGCWVWQRLVSHNGYGRIVRDGKDYRAHRVYYEQRFGELAPEMQLHHRCRNKRCVNPDHLEPMTAEQHRQLVRHGKLGPTEVQHIRALAANTSLTQREIAARFGVSSTQVSRILRGQRWGRWTTDAA
jgi:hypothetical protein